MIWRSLRNAEASIHISEKKRVGGNLAEGSRAGASYRGVMPGGHFYREALFSFFTSFIASTQVESMTAASPFMKFIELIGQLCSVTRSCGIIVTSCTRHAFYQFIFELQGSQLPIEFSLFNAIPVDNEYLKIKLLNLLSGTIVDMFCLRFRRNW